MIKLTANRGWVLFISEIEKRSRVLEYRKFEYFEGRLFRSLPSAFEYLDNFENVEENVVEIKSRFIEFREQQKQQNYFIRLKELSCEELIKFVSSKKNM